MIESKPSSVARRGEPRVQLRVPVGVGEGREVHQLDCGDVGRVRDGRPVDGPPGQRVQHALTGVIVSTNGMVDLPTPHARMCVTCPRFGFVRASSIFGTISSKWSIRLFLVMSTSIGISVSVMLC